MFDQAASEGVMYRETPLFRNISSAFASKPIWHPNLIVRKKEKKICCYRNMLLLAGFLESVSAR